MLDRLVGELTSMSDTFSLRFTHLDDGHARLERRLDIVDEKLDETRQTVARLVGERSGAEREESVSPNPQSIMRRLSVGSAIAVGMVTVLGGLSAAYTMAEKLLAAIVRAISAP